MSVKTMSQVWELDLATSEKFVLLAYADHTDHDGNGAYPAIARIAWKTGLSERQVQRIVKKLVEANLLEVDKKRVGKTTIYNVRCENGKQLEPLYAPDTMSPLTNNVTPTPDTMSPPPLTPVSPEPSFKPSLEPSQKDSTATAKTADVGGTVDPPKSEPNETPEKQDTPEKSSPVKGETFDLYETLMTESSILRRLLTLRDTALPPRPSEVWTAKGKGKSLVSGFKNTPFYQTLEAVLYATSHPKNSGKNGYLMGRVIDFLLKETDAGIPDVVRFFIWYMENKPELTLPKNPDAWERQWREWRQEKVVTVKVSQKDCPICKGVGKLRVPNPDPLGQTTYTDCQCMTSQQVVRHAS